MSMPLDQQQQQLSPPPPPPLAVTLEPYNGHHSSQASIGPVIAVLMVIIILGVIAIMIGRLCTGRRILGYGQYDIESWAESKCSTCIDGTISPPPPPTRLEVTENSAAPTPEPIQTPQHDETAQEEQEHSPTHQNDNDS